MIRESITDCRHLNIRIAKTNLAYPLVRDTRLVLGNSKCKVLSVLDLKDAFHLVRLLEEAKNITIFWKHIIYIKGCLWV